jgi:outer membrane protein, heavy metal efflux system
MTALQEQDVILHCRHHVIAIVAALAAAAAPAAGQPVSSTSPLRLGDAVSLATERRAEIEAARARARAGEARPSIVSALDEPMIAPSLDHLPFMLNGANVSFTIEQRIPLSSIREHRRESALADLDRLRAETTRTTLDVGLEAATAFLMLQERQRMTDLLREQLTFARDVVNAADARYAGGTGVQSDVLRAEVEVARIEAQLARAAGEVRAAEAMFNTSIGVEPDRPIPPLAVTSIDRPLPKWDELKTRLTSRPELVAARADITRADAEIRVMRDMYRPMATIRTGPAYTMAEGRGWMAMVGLSVPIWRSKLRAGVAEAQAMRQMSEAEVRAMTRMIEGEAAAALHELQAAGDQQAAIRDNVLPRARVALDPALSGYSVGRLPLVSVIEAIQALWSVQAELIDADVRVGVAWTRLGRATGSFEVLEP